MVKGKEYSWISGSIADIERVGNLEHITGYFEIAIPIHPDHPMTVSYQALRRHVIGLKIFGDSPSMSIRNYEEAPYFAVKQPGFDTYVHYRGVDDEDIPSWPGIISYPEGERHESI